MRRRRAGGAQRLDVTELRKLILDDQIHAAVGIVTLFPGETQHYELDAEDVLVDVQLMPNGEPALCRLGAAAGGGGGGVWKIPPVGTEVAVLVPLGDLGHDPIIVATLASGAVPSGLATDTIVIKETKVHVVASEVMLGADNLVATDGLVHGSGIDPFTGATYYALGNASGVVKGKK